MATITSPRNPSPAPSSPRITSPSLVSDPSVPSIRGSLELSRNSVPRARGNRAALRDYYNLKSNVPATPSGLSRTASFTSTTSDSTATSSATLHDDHKTISALTAPLDNPSFEVGPWLQNLLRTGSLQEVLKTEATLVSEIRNLDGERKALVYDNYNKLIKAVSTIGEMQRGMTTDAGLNGIKDLDVKMDRLHATARDIAAMGKGELQSREESQARKRYRLDKKKKSLVQWVVDAPRRLAAMKENGEVDAANREWREVKQYLDRWSNVTGVQQVRETCEQMMESSRGEVERLEVQDA